MHPEAQELIVDVFADIVCPWCYIGERRLQQAIGAVEPEGLQVSVRWRPFQLQPQMPAGGLPWRAFAERKFGGWDRAQAAFRRVEAAAREDGLAFDFARVATAPNTVDAHRLILWAQDQGAGEAAAEALFRAYFADGADLNDADQLAAIAARAGLDAESARAMLATEAYHADVERGQRFADQAGIGGVPLFIVADRYALSGAQPAEALAQALRRSAVAGAQP